MAYISVQELRSLVNSIPNQQNASLLLIQEGVPPPYPVVRNRVVNPDGSEAFTVEGYVDFANKIYFPV